SLETFLGGCILLDRSRLSDRLRLLLLLARVAHPKPTHILPTTSFFTKRERQPALANRQSGIPRKE
ncbi:MAG: hypothetical protein AB7T14_08140, partial [Candidatus Methylacidiphilaceae bacterium]